MTRPPNSERCDLYVTDVQTLNEKAMFLVECKYRQDNLNIAVISEILESVSKQWESFLVFCQTVADLRRWNGITKLLDVSMCVVKMVTLNGFINHYRKHIL